MKDFFSIKVKDIKRQTGKAVEVSFDIPQDLKNIFTYEPGQYITLSTTVNGVEVRRSYSICSSPEDDLSVVVKAIPDGIFSNFINLNLKSGDFLNIMPPEGFFTFNKLLEDKNYCAFVAGSGITPVMALVKSVLKNTKTSRFVLVYGNKSPQETIFFDELVTLKTRYPNRFYVENIYSEAQEDEAHFGRIEKPIINYVIKNKYSNFIFLEYFICGPESMIEHVKATLLDYNTEPSKIKYELFYSKNETKDIQPSDGLTRLKVIVDDQEYELTMDKNSVILDAILDKDIDVPYSCQGGICSSCLAKIKTGKAEMRKNQILTDDEVEEGLVLTCQAQPQSADVVVDYDDI